MGTSKLSTTHYHNLRNMFSQSANKKWHFTNLKLCPLDDSTSVWWSGTRYACLWSDCINSPYMNFNRHILSIRRLEKLVKSRDCPDGYRSGRPHVTLKRQNKRFMCYYVLSPLKIATQISGAHSPSTSYKIVIHEFVSHWSRAYRPYADIAMY